jgi:hypothetical protein
MTLGRLSVKWGTVRQAEILQAFQERPGTIKASNDCFTFSAMLDIASAAYVQSLSVRERYIFLRQAVGGTNPREFVVDEIH